MIYEIHWPRLSISVMSVVYQRASWGWVVVYVLRLLNFLLSGRILTFSSLSCTALFQRTSVIPSLTLVPRNTDFQAASAAQRTLSVLESLFLARCD